MVAVNDETLAITAKINTTPTALAIIMDMASLIILFNWVYEDCNLYTADATAARVDGSTRDDDVTI